MPTYRVSITCPVQITYYVEAPDEHDAADVDVSLDDIVYASASGGLSTKRGVTLELLTDGADYDNIDSIRDDNVDPRFLLNPEE